MKCLPVLAALGLASSVVAQETLFPPPGIEALPMAQCTALSVIARLRMEAVYYSARVVEAQKKPVEQWKALVARDRPNRPLSEALSSDDLQKFGHLDQQYNVGRVAQLVESMRERDLEVLAKQMQLAGAEYASGTHPEEGSPDYMAYRTLNLLRATWQDDDTPYQPPRQAPCSLDYALAKLADVPMQRSTKLAPQVQKANAWVDQLLARYKMKRLDESKLSKTELATLNRHRAEVYAPFNQATTYVKDLANLRQMAKASDIMYDDNRRDTELGAGDPTAIGTNTDQRKAAGDFDERMQAAIRMWNLIDQEIPAPILAQWKDFAEILKRTKKGGK